MKKHQILAYCGPNRRSDTTMVEILLGYDAKDLEHVKSHRSEAAEFLEEQFRRLALPMPATGFGEHPAGPAETFGQWCADIGLALQSGTGHRVSQQALLPAAERSRISVLFEHEHSEIGERAAELALHLLSLAYPGLDWDAPVEAGSNDFDALFEDFRDVSETQVMPRDTEAIIRAANKAGVPVVKLERDPYEPVRGDFRIRMNSMLMLGHAQHRQVLDGTLALEQARFDSRLIQERSVALELLASQNLPVPETKRYTQPAFGPSRARRLRDQLGGAVAVKPGRRSAGRGVAIGLDRSQEIGRAIDAALRHGREVLVQAFVPGDAYRLLFAGNQLAAVLGPEGSQVREDVFEAALVDKLAELARALNAGLVMYTLVSSNPSAPMENSGTVFIDIEVAPQIDRYVESAPDLLDAAADRFIAWLFPPGMTSRIPLVAITGTNGKTTTTRMINHVLKGAGRAPGMVCTEGIHIGDEVVETEDLSNLMGHYRVYENRFSDCAVLEANHRGLAAYGLSFDWCDVAVVTNVTNDHIGDWGIETVADMAELKRSLPERGRVVILNADNEHCRNMIPHLEPEKLILSSIESSGIELLDKEERASEYVALETHDGEEWIVIGSRNGASRVVRVAEIPATFDGAARFNVSNAMQAIAASHEIGVSIEDIASAISSFRTSPEVTPGRLNVFDDLPFRVIVDFAHNPDGIRQLCKFVDHLKPSGRKLLALAGSGDRSDEIIISTAAEAAGHFDHYICKDYLDLRGRKPNEAKNLLKRSLMDHGVDEGNITIVGEASDGLGQVFSLCREGDLLILLLGNIELHTASEQIRDFKQGLAG